MLRASVKLVCNTTKTTKTTIINNHITRNIIPIQYVGCPPICRSMGFWGDFVDRFKSEYANNPELKKSVQEVTTQANKVADASSKITKAAKSKVGAVSESISKTLPQSDPNQPGKVSEGVKKALDFLGNRLTFVGEAKNPYTKEKGKKDDKSTTSSQEKQPEQKTTKDGKDTTTDKSSATSEADKPPKEKKEKVTKEEEKTKEVEPLSEEEKKIAPGGGESLVLRPQSEWERYWERFGGDTATAAMKGTSSYVTNSIRRMIPESTIATTVAKIKDTVNPDFTLHSFLKEMETTIPEAVQAIISEDLPTIRAMSSNKFYRTMANAAAAESQRGVYQDSQLIDVSQIELWEAKIDPTDDKPFLLLGCHIQLVFICRNRKGEIVAGAEDDIKSAFVTMAFKPDMSETQLVVHDMHIINLQSFL